MRIRLLLGILGIGLLVGAYLVASGALKGQLEAFLSQATQRRVAIQSAHLILPSGVNLRGITVPPGPGEEGPPISIKEMSIQMSFLSLLKGRPGVAVELASPRLFIERSPEGILRPALVAGLPPRGSGQTPGSSGQRQAVFPVTRLRVRDGELTFLDRMVIPEVSWNIRDIRVSISAGPRPGGYTFSLLGDLIGSSREGLGRIEINGEAPRADTAEGKVSLRMENLRYFAPYVRRVLGTAPVRGSCLATAKVTVFQGGIVADTQWMASQVFFDTAEPTVLGPAGNRLVELLQDPKGQIHLDFVVKGRLGERLDWSDLVTAALRQAMRQALARSIQKVLTETEQIPIEELIRRGLESLGR